MNRDDEFLRKAEEALQRARAAGDDERANWLLVAEGWLGLLGECQEIDEEAFLAAQKGGQDASKFFLH